MSRSYRKHYIRKDKNLFGKKYANRMVRRKLNQEEDLPPLSDADYKKFYDSWNISDFSFGFISQNSFLNYEREYYDSDEECLRDFKRWWKSK